MPKYSLAGLSVRYDEAYLPVGGILCTSRDLNPFAVQGVCTLLVRHFVLVIGTPLWSGRGLCIVKGFTDLIPYSLGWAVKAVREGKDFSVYSVESVTYLRSYLYHLVTGASSHAQKLAYGAVSIIRASAESKFTLKGDVSGEEKKIIMLLGAISHKAKEVYIVNGLKATGSNFVAKIKGAVGQTQKLRLKATGRLGGNIARATLAIVGLIPKIAFIASVPKRFQYFTTNKRWFR